MAAIDRQFMRQRARRDGVLRNKSTSRERVMRKLMLISLGFAVMSSALLSLTGCVVVAPRPHYVARVWVPGYWAPTGVWVSGHWHG
jgi:hypothetical protein